MVAEAWATEKQALNLINEYRSKRKRSSVMMRMRRRKKKRRSERKRRSGRKRRQYRYTVTLPGYLSPMSVLRTSSFSAVGSRNTLLTGILGVGADVVTAS